MAELFLFLHFSWDLAIQRSRLLRAMPLPSESLGSGVLDSVTFAYLIVGHTQAAEVSLGYCLLPSNLQQFEKGY